MQCLWGKTKTMKLKGIFVCFKSFKEFGMNSVKKKKAKSKPRKLLTKKKNLTCKNKFDYCYQAITVFTQSCKHCILI